MPMLLSDLYDTAKVVISICGFITVKNVRNCHRYTMSSFYLKRNGSFRVIHIKCNRRGFRPEFSVFTRPCERHLWKKYSPLSTENIYLFGSNSLHAIIVLKQNLLCTCFFLYKNVHPLCWGTIYVGNCQRLLKLSVTRSRMVAQI